MILVIDNYDSFVFNLVHYLEELGGETRVERNDALTAQAFLALEPDAVVLSPGPCTPNHAGSCVELVKRAPKTLPMLGVCLGHQAIAQAFGATIGPARDIVHGKTSNIRHDGSGVFAGLPETYSVTRYHSLGVDAASVPDALRVTAHTDDGEIMGLAHVSKPVFGVQFHPESIASEHGHALLANFLAIAGVKASTA